jgi:hypothetical protein
LQLVLQLLRKNTSVFNKYKWSELLLIAVDICFIGVLILMIDYEFVVFPQSASRKYNFICAIVSVESTEVNNIFETMWVTLCQFKRHLTVTFIFHLLSNNVYKSTKLAMQKYIQLLNVMRFYYFTCEIRFFWNHNFCNLSS